MSSSTFPIVIGTYEYVYGAGSAPNRKIEFYGDGEKHINGIIQGKVKGAWKEIGKIDEAHMVKEGASTTEKVDIMMAARERGCTPEYPPNKSFDDLSYDEKVKVIENLRPMGSYRIEVVNNIGCNPYFEKVERLNFFDPS